jgi:TolB-like protein/class 3 adenylate cyclase/Tfp pilus assembly protein PilF
MTEARAERRLAAIVVIDIVGYSRLIEADEAGTLHALGLLRAQIIDPAIARHSGRIFKTTGDGVIAEFASVVDAVGAGLAIQKDMAQRRAEEGSALKLRIGINLGDVVVEAGDLLGDGVNIAARLEQLCPPDGILLSGTVHDHLKGKLDLKLDDMGSQRVKNIAKPVRVYSLRLPGQTVSWRLRLRRFDRMAKLAAAALVLLIAAGIAAWWTLRAPDPVGRASVAVLPFDNLVGDEATRRLADGITEDIITDLSRFPDFNVIARNSTAAFAGKGVDIRKVGEKLKVRYVLEGSVQRDAEAIRVTAQLIEAASGTHIWAEQWNRKAEDLFAVQTEIVRELVNRLGGSGVIMAAENRAASRKKPENLSAYENYLLGRDRILNPTKERLDEAIVLFKRALAEDPGLARAWVDLAWAYDQSTGFGADWAVMHPLAVEAARRAVATDPMDAGAHAVLGIMLGVDGDLARAKAELDTALRLNPGSADILTMYAGWASTFGDPAGGGEMADRALRMNPGYPPAQSGFFYFAYFMAGRYEDALAILQKQPVEMRSKSGWVILPATLSALGRADEAKAVVAEALKRYPDLTAEGFLIDEGFVVEREQRALAENMRNAGFPACAPAEKLKRIAKPFRLPECVAAGEQTSQQ